MVAAASVLAPVAVQVLAVAAQVLAIMGDAAFVLADPALIVAQLAAVFADVAVACAAIRLAEIAAQVLADVAELVWIAIAGLVQPAGALGHFIRAQSLQPVDPVGQFRATDTLLGPAADHLPQTLSKGRIAQAAGCRQVSQGLPKIGPRSQSLTPRRSTHSKGHGERRHEEKVLHSHSPSVFFLGVKCLTGATRVETPTGKRGGTNSDE